MSGTLFIENLDGSVTASQLTTLLSEHGKVGAVELAKDDTSDEGTQVAFVTMQNAKHGRAAIAGLDGQTHSNRVLKVKALRGRGPSSGGMTSPGGLGTGGVAGGRRSTVFGARSGTYGHKGRGKSGGRNS